MMTGIVQLASTVAAYTIVLARVPTKKTSETGVTKDQSNLPLFLLYVASKIFLKGQKVNKGWVGYLPLSLQHRSCVKMGYSVAKLFQFSREKNKKSDCVETMM
jgi:hypothetical protein